VDQAASSGTHRTVQPFSIDSKQAVPHTAASAASRADSEIYGDGDESTSFYKVLSGVVRTCKFRSDGRRQIDGFHLAGKFSGSPRRQAFFSAKQFATAPSSLSLAGI